MANKNMTSLVWLSAVSISFMTGWWWTYEMPLVNRPATFKLAAIREDMAVRDQQSTFPVKNEIWPTHHLLCPNRKRRNFPHFSYPPSTPRNWINDMDTTNATFTRILIVSPKEIYSVCDELELLIEARNGYGEPKTYGGDLFRAKIFTKEKSFRAGSGTDGEVIDLGNGNYSAFFTMKWTGTVRISVTLVAPSEAVYELDNLRKTLQPREHFKGKFRRRIGENYVEEVVSCNHVPVGRLTSICNLSDASVGLTWYCQRPKSPGLSCSDWTAIITDEWNLNKMREDQAFSRRSSVVHRSPIPVAGLPNHVSVHNNSDDFVKQLDRLPVCGQQSNGIQVIPWVAGFYENDRWFPPNCKVKHFPADGAEMKKCLVNKNIYFYGDSTIRQAYSYLARSILGARVFRQDLQKWVENDDRYESEHNIHMHYGFHHVPIRHFHWHNVSKLHFVTNELDRIGSNESAVVVICLWAHFQSLSRSFYEQRIKSIADAAQRLINRNPRATVMFKGGNTQNPYGSRVQYLNEYYARDNEESLRRILNSFPKIHFLDAWDMSKGQLALADTHPPQPHLSNLIDQMLTIVCPTYL